MPGLMSSVSKIEPAYVVARCLLNAAYAAPGVRGWLIRRHAPKLGRADASYSLGVLNWHLSHIAPDRKVEGRVYAELGPGTNVGTLVALLLLGARRVYAFDIIPYEQWRDDTPGLIRTVRSAMEGDERLQLPEADVIEARARRLEQTGLRDLEYIAPYDCSLAPIPDGELDGVYSHTVLQYVDSLRDLHRGIHRCLKPGAAASHHIDLTSQGLSSGCELLHLRHPRWLWSLMSCRHPGAETRLRRSDHVAAAEAAGLKVEVVGESLLPALPYVRHRLSRPFRDKSEDDLRCIMAHLVTRRPSRSADEE